MVNIAVLRQKIHGRPASEYATAIRERLPEADVSLAETPAEQRAALETADVATGFRLDAADLERASNLKLFACVYAGTGHLDLETFEERGVAVTNASGVHGPNISEYVVGGVIQHLHGFKRAWRQQQQRHWRAFPGEELYGKTVTVVGLGAIGRAVVDRLEPFGVETLGVRYTPEKGGPTDEVFGFDEIHEPLTRSDVVVLACPLTETTRGLIDREALLSMPPHVLLVNVARGAVVDTEALVSALRSDDLGGAVLDVTDPEPLPEEHPLWSFEEVTVTPHNSGQTPEYYERVADILAKNVQRARETGSYEGLENQVV